MDTSNSSNQKKKLACKACGSSDSLRIVTGPFGKYNHIYGKIMCCETRGGCGAFVKNQPWPDHTNKNHYPHLKRITSSICDFCAQPVMVEMVQGIALIVDPQPKPFLMEYQGVHRLVYGRTIHSMTCEKRHLGQIRADKICKSCNAPLRYVRLMNDKGGSEPHPVDPWLHTFLIVPPEPDENGEPVEPKPYEVRQVAQGYVSHFATCTHSNKHRKKKRGEGGKKEGKEFNKIHPRAFDIAAIKAQPIKELALELGVLEQVKGKGGRARYRLAGSDSSGSISINEKDNTFHDFNPNGIKGGKSIFDLVMAAFGMDFESAGRHIAEHTGLWNKKEEKK